MKVINPHSIPFYIPGVATVAPGGTVDVPAELGRELVAEGWRKPAASKPKKTPADTAEKAED